MWDYDHNTIPYSIKVIFKRANNVHKYNTRGAAKGNLYCTKVNTTKHGIYSFKYQGIQILNNLKKLSFYQDTHLKSKCLKNLKSYLLSKYQ